MKVKKGEKLCKLCLCIACLLCMLHIISFALQVAYCFIVRLLIARFMFSLCFCFYCSWSNSLYHFKRGRNLRIMFLDLLLISLIVHCNQFLGYLVIYYLDYCWLFFLKNKVYHSYLVNVWWYIYSYKLLFLFMTFDNHDFVFEILIWRYDATI